MGRKARAAGARLEREVAKDLRTWLGEGWVVLRNQTDRQRGGHGLTPGEFTVYREDSPAGQAADGPERFPFAVECKANMAFTALHLWSPTKLLTGWWEQAQDQAGADYLPLLICSGRHNAARLEPVLAIARPGVWARLGLYRDGTARHRFLLDGTVLEAVEWREVTGRPVSGLVEIEREVADA